MNVDVIMLCKSDSQRNIRMTKRSILSMKDAEKDFSFHIHLVESAIDMNREYVDIVENYILPKENFNYNRFINHALHHIKHDWVVIANNDVGYEKGWFTEIMKIHEKRPDIHSFSPKDPALFMKFYDWHFIDSPDEYFESYIVTESVAGWCIVIKKESLDKIIPFDEQFDFYYQDNDYSKTIEKLGIKHALVRNSLAVHYPSIINSRITNEIMIKMNEGETKFNNKWK